jgi:hypothetical protein
MNYPYAATNNGTATLVKAGRSDLFAIAVDNEDASARYVQLFDAVAAASVTLGSTAPTHSFRVPASGSFVFTPPKAWPFQLGVVIAVTTTRAGATAVTTPANVNARLG